MGSDMEGMARQPGASGDEVNPDFAQAEHGQKDDRWFRVMRRLIRGRPTLNLFYRMAVAVVGLSVIVIGIVLLPLPGPGWLIIFAGLAVLATEFAWAGRLLSFARHKVLAWTEWMKDQSLLVRGLVGLAGLLLLGAIAYAIWYVNEYGTPGWVPLIG